MQTPEPNLAFYQQLFTETLFVLPEENAIPENSAPTVSKPEAVSQTPEVKTAGIQEKNYVFSGQNLKGLVLIFRLPEPDFFTLQQNTFLLNILKAIGYGPADVGFVNLKPEVKIDLKSLQQDLKISAFLSFGQKFQATDKPYIPQIFESIPYLISESLAAIEADQEKKKKLWGALQQIFLKQN